MTIQLLRNGEPVLTARSNHRKGDSYRYLPISYEGDTSLLKNTWAETNVMILKAAFSIAASKHGLQLAGDYDDFRLRCSLPGGEEWERFLRENEKKRP